MKLLLTSGGLTNKSISRALFELIGKDPEDTSLVFIPTASNVESGDKGWLIEDLINLHNQKFKSIAIVDISAVPENIWRPQMEEADVLFFEGGNTYHLMEWINKSGLSKLLPEFLKTKVYVGLSAGSMVACPDLSLKHSKIIYDENLNKKDILPALNLVDFYFLPHLNSKHFPKVNEKNLREVSKDITRKIYALDDMSALKIIDGEVEIVSEGEYLILN